jgi:hypothetical protein
MKNLIYVSTDLKEISTERSETCCNAYELINDNRLRSIEQNRFYWALLHVISEEIGYSSQELHDYGKYKLIARPLFEVAGHDLPNYAFHEFLNSEGSVIHSILAQKVISTTSLSKAEFTAYLNHFVEYAKNLGIDTELIKKDTNKLYEKSQRKQKELK